MIATATQLTIESIAQAYENSILDKKLPLREIFICGGGAKNPTLLERLQIRLPQVKISRLEDSGVDPQFVEAQAFAIYGFLAILGKNLGGTWTGSTEFGPPGHIIPGENWKTLIKKISLLL